MGASAGPDTAGVDLRVQAVVGLVGGGDGTHFDTGCIVTMHTENGLEPHANIGERAFHVSLNPNPLRRAAMPRRLGAGHRHVVLLAASDHASFAARAAVKIDSHSPLGHTFITFLISTIGALRRKPSSSAVASSRE